MSFDVSLARVGAVTASVRMPPRGLWSAQVHLEDDTDLAVGARVTLEIGDLALDGAIARGGPFAQTAAYLVRAGRGGWGKVVKARSYSSSRVMLSKVLTDLAFDCGEEWTPGFGPGFQDRPVGQHHWRREEVASLVLGKLLGRAWYVADDGRTVAGDRPAGRSNADVLELRRARRLVLLDTDAPARARPGQTVSVDGESLVLGTVTATTGDSGTSLVAEVA